LPILLSPLNRNSQYAHDNLEFIVLPLSLTIITGKKVNENIFLGLPLDSPKLEDISEQTKEQLEMLKKNLDTSK